MISPLLKPEQVQVILKDVKELIERYVKKKPYNTVQVGIQDGEGVVLVEGPDDLTLELSMWMEKNKHVHVNKKEFYKGSFDWASDTYIKDCNLVTFSLKP